MWIMFVIVYLVRYIARDFFFSFFLHDGVQEIFEVDSKEFYNAVKMAV
jgi:hypothetical protein